MQLAAVAALFAALAAAAPASHVARDIGVFEVSDFTAACESRNGKCNYDFHLYNPSTTEARPGVHCQALNVPASPGGVLPPVYGTCINSARTWFLSKKHDGTFALTAREQATPKSDTVGSYTCHPVDIRYDPSGVQYYNGPKFFELLRVN